MRHFLLFITGLAALAVLIFNLGPMILLGISVLLLYLIFKQFVKASSVISKTIWVILGFIVLSISLSNLYALIAIVAACLLYWIYKNWHKDDAIAPNVRQLENDPFTNFEYEWQELSNKKL